MEYNFNNLEDMLRAGVKAEEIAQYFTKNLNEAIDKVHKDNRKQELAENLAVAWNGMIDLWLETHKLPEGFERDDAMIDPPTVIRIFDEMMDTFCNVADLTNVLVKAFDAVPLKDEKNPAPVKNNTDDENVLDSFEALIEKLLNNTK